VSGSNALVGLYFVFIFFGCLAITIWHEIAVGRLLINLFINFHCRLH